MLRLLMPATLGQESALFTLMGKRYALMGLGSYHESVQLFDQAPKLDPNSGDARLYEGRRNRQ